MDASAPRRLPESCVAALDLLGRAMLVSLFLLEGWSKIGQYGRAGLYMQAFGVPAELLPLVIALELGAGLLILFGWQTRLASLALAGFCLGAALIFHRNWADTNQLLHFEKNVALAGAFVPLAARGADRWSLDALLTPR